MSCWMITAGSVLQCVLLSSALSSLLLSSFIFFFLCSSFWLTWAKAYYPCRLVENTGGRVYLYVHEPNMRIK